MNYPKRLIEVDLPIARISGHARAEKDSRVAHVPRLHIYPAARPLAACRAVMLASLWPDPVDLTVWLRQAEEGGQTGPMGPEIRAPQKEKLKAGEGVVIRPQRFLNEARAEMTRWARIGLKKEKHPSAETIDRLMKIREKQALLHEPEVLRAVLLDFIADFANWDNSTDVDYLGTSRALVLAAHEALGGEDGSRPMVIDPFAGGGAIPLEATRVDASAVASDLNPVASVLNSILLEAIPGCGPQIVPDLESWTRSLVTAMRQRLSALYPTDPDGSKPVAYLWARTVVSEAPGDGEPIEIPLIKTMRLTRNRRGGDWILRWSRDARGAIKTTVNEVLDEDGRLTTVRRPQIEVVRIGRTDRIEPGTTQRSTATCPVTGYTMPAARVRAQLARRRGGTKDARLYCVVIDDASGGNRRFRPATDTDVSAARHATTILEENQWEPPDEALPPAGAIGFSVQNYGMQRWSDLFTDRQLAALLCACDAHNSHLEAKEREGWDSKRLRAMRMCGAAMIDRLADLNSAQCRWQLNTPNTVNSFSRWAVPIILDFGEVNPIAAAGGSPESALSRAKHILENLTSAAYREGVVLQSDAAALPLPDESFDLLITDPPYYDAIPYSNLLDFFVVWLKRTIGVGSGMALEEGLGPKARECIVDRGCGKNHEFFNSTMTDCMNEARRVTVPGGLSVVVFAHKSTSGWEAQLDSVLSAGWAISASWPIDTEMASRTRAHDSAALASSVHLVCRRRSRNAGVGDWRDVIDELPGRIHDWMPRLAGEGVVGADAIFACLGPALEIFSRYSRVEKASGEAVTLREYLEQVWAAVSNEALSMIFKDADAAGLEPDGRLTAMWLWTLGAGAGVQAASQKGAAAAVEEGNAEEDDEDEARASRSGGKKSKTSGFVLEFDAARKIAQGLGAHLEKMPSVVEVKGDKARLLSVAERMRHLFGKDSDADEAAGGRRRKKKPKQLGLYEALDEVEQEQTGGSGFSIGAIPMGETVLDRVHQSMILFAGSRGEALRRFLVEDGAGTDARFWKLAQSLSALYPPGTDEKRWVDGVLARKKGLGL
ncbi:MAG: DUF1156 domain-containing protein [Phycisphaerales bacterium]